jgi:uncharacterized protein involved in exopolysaccharide biosynthesis
MAEPGNLHEYWSALYERRRLIAIVSGASFGFALVLSWILPGFYEARTVLYLPFGLQAISYSVADASLAQAPLLPTAEEKAAGTHVGILRSKDLARRVHEQFPDRSIGWLREHVDFVVGKEYLTEIYVRDRDPAVAAGIANAYAEAYEAFHRDAMARRSRSARDVIEANLAGTHGELAEKRARLAELQQQTGAFASSDERERLTSLGAQLGQELATTRADLAATRGRVASFERELAEERKLFRGSEAVLTNPRIERLEQQLADLEVEMAGLENTHTTEHPVRVATSARLRETGAALEAERKRLAASRTKEPGSTYEALRQRLAEEQSQERYLNARAEALERSLGETSASKLELGNRLAELDDVQRRVEELVSLQSALDRNLQEARLQAEHPAPTVVVSERAMPPEALAFPRPLLNASVAAVLGFAVGCYYALLVDYLERLRRERVRRDMDWSLLSDDLGQREEG